MSRFEIREDRRKSKISEKIIYQVFLRTFTQEGTIKAATQRLEHNTKFVRKLDGEKICVIANFEDQPVRIPIIDGEELISGRVEITETDITLFLGSYIAIRQKEGV